jgi:hypothetical protein
MVSFTEAHPAIPVQVPTSGSCKPVGLAHKFLVASLSMVVVCVVSVAVFIIPFIGLFGGPLLFVLGLLICVGSLVNDTHKGRCPMCGNMLHINDSLKCGRCRKRIIRNGRTLQVIL